MASANSGQPGENSAPAAQTGKIVSWEQFLFPRKKRRHNRLTISFSLMKCQVTWLWMASVLSFTRSNTSWGNWETFVIKTNSTIIVHSFKIIILFPHSINPIYGGQRSFEVPRSVKLHKKLSSPKTNQSCRQFIYCLIKTLDFEKVVFLRDLWKANRVYENSFSNYRHEKAVHLDRKVKKYGFY